MPEIETGRLVLDRFTTADAPDVFAAITPAVTRWMTWEPPTWAEFEAHAARLAAADPRAGANFVIRLRDTGRCLGITAAERLADDLPELGIWLRADAHGQGFGLEAARALLRWASAASGAAGFVWPVAVENAASRRIAERLGGEIVAERPGAKYDAVIYRIPAAQGP
ncbi:MAG: GNAT family N-acetyltransferase [Phenylobacterium sp.]|uniref:GNAT family N-acetyltransferase n=1 Tax=Phenylobacterium sp. TaxID=1871053 RepID=UPI001A4402E8|nr:GNAT family N-acetyltransferase [Phenylobacterium sp.]MBL8773923.1 GNAT family N-acetyltransferase [Phenylobacterium sp.]